MSNSNIATIFAAANKPQVAAPAAKGSNNADYVKAQTWLDMGVVAPMKDSEGVVAQTFIPLPRGIAIDTMEPRTIKASDTPEWIKGVAASNSLLAAIQAKAAALEPGESDVLTIPLVIKIRKVAAAKDMSNAPVEDDLAALQSMLAGF